MVHSRNSLRKAVCVGWQQQRSLWQELNQQRREREQIGGARSDGEGAREGLAGHRELQLFLCVRSGVATLPSDLVHLNRVPRVLCWEQIKGTRAERFFRVTCNAEGQEQEGNLHQRSWVGARPCRGIRTWHILPWESQCPNSWDPASQRWGDLWCFPLTTVYIRSHTASITCLAPDHGGTQMAMHISWTLSAAQTSSPAFTGRCKPARLHSRPSTFPSP